MSFSVLERVAACLGKMNRYPIKLDLCVCVLKGVIEVYMRYQFLNKKTRNKDDMSSSRVLTTFRDQGHIFGSGG